MQESFNLYKTLSQIVKNSSFLYLSLSQVGKNKKWTDEMFC